MDIRKHATRYSAFIIESEDLKKLEKLIRESFDSISYTVWCSDDTVRSYKDIKSITEYENPVRSEMKRITMKAESEKGGRFLEMELSSKNVIENVSFSLAGPELSVSNFTGKIEDFLAGVKPWYSFLAVEDIYRFGAIVMLPVFLSIIFVQDIAVWLVVKIVSDVKYVKLFMFFYYPIFVALMLMILYLMVSLKRYVFPIGDFVIGQGKKRHLTRSNIRAGVIILGLLVGVVSNVIASFII